MICKYCGKFYFKKNKSNEKCEIEFKEIKNIILSGDRIMLCPHLI